MNGTAVDIRCMTSNARKEILKALLSAGFNRIGVAKTFIHVDDDKAKPQNVVWLYK